MQQVSIRSAGIGIDVALRDHIRGRLQHKLARFAHHVDRSSVLITSDAASGVDAAMSCSIDLRLSDTRDLRVLERGATPREAFDRAAGAIERALRRANLVDPAQPRASAPARTAAGGTTARRSGTRKVSAPQGRAPRNRARAKRVR